MVSASLVERIAGAFGAFAERYRRFFATRARDNSAVAERYLQGLTQARECTFEGMAAVVAAACPQRFQHFISNSPWDHEPVLAQLSCDADMLVGGKPESCLIIDETSFIKQGERSVGVARQWSGRLGKVDNCQVAVFAVLSDGRQNVPIDMRLYLPRKWVEDEARCERAGVPPSARQLKSKSEHALDLVRTARARGVRFQWVGVVPATARNQPFCGRWMMNRWCSLPMCSARKRCGCSGPRSRCRPDGRDRVGPRRNGGARPVASRRRTWSEAFAPKTGHAWFCATAPAVRCGWMSPVGGSGCGMARKPNRGAGS